MPSPAARRNDLRGLLLALAVVISAGAACGTRSLELFPEATANAGAGGAGGADGSSALTADAVQAAVAAYAAIHSGNGGKDHDIIGCCAGASRTEAEIAADAAAVQLRAICGPGQMPVIPQLAWEYGGTTHAWINPSAAALVYCVYIPNKTSSAHWSYDPVADKVTVEVYVKFPAQDPCNAMTAAQTLAMCIGDLSGTANVEILIDTASFHDGADIGLHLSSASTDVFMVMPDGTRVLMYQGA